MRVARTRTFLIAASLVCAAAAGAVRPAESTRAEHAAKPPFTLKISPKPYVFTVGSPMPINVVLTNVSSHPLSLIRPSWGAYEADIWNSHGALVKAKPLAEKLPDGSVRIRHLGGSVFSDQVKPGKTLLGFCRLDLDYELTKPGKYTVQLRRYDYENKRWVRSNTISIVVIPK